jgi:methylated-DNA-[protein]-cysteine S-methyltransferase
MTQFTFRLEHVPTPTGLMLLVTDELGRIRALDWETHTERMWRLFGRHYGPSRVVLNDTQKRSSARHALEAYYAGDLHALDAVAVETGGTAFQRTCWSALRAIPPGVTRTYGQQAQAIGKPTAFRAIGLANGANPVAIAVPCHRVIGASGGLTGYGGGMERKQWLLRHEGVEGV